MYLICHRKSQKKKELGGRLLICYGPVLAKQDKDRLSLNRILEKRVKELGFWHKVLSDLVKKA